MAITTPQHCICDRQVGRKNSIHRQAVGRERVLPTDRVYWAKSRWESLLPTDISLPTDSWMAIQYIADRTSLGTTMNLSRPISVGTVLDLFPTDCLTVQSLPTDILLALLCIFPDGQLDGVVFYQPTLCWLCHNPLPTDNRMLFSFPIQQFVSV